MPHFVKIIGPEVARRTKVKEVLSKFCYQAQECFAPNNEATIIAAGYYKSGAINPAPVDYAELNSLFYPGAAAAANHQSKDLITIECHVVNFDPKEKAMVIERLLAITPHPQRKRNLPLQCSEQTSRQIVQDMEYLMSGLAFAGILPSCEFSYPSFFDPSQKNNCTIRPAFYRGDASVLANQRVEKFLTAHGIKYTPAFLSNFIIDDIFKVIRLVIDLQNDHTMLPAFAATIERVKNVPAVQFFDTKPKRSVVAYGAVAATVPHPVEQFTDDMLRSFQCPITLNIMQNPVIAADGYSYEAEAIKRRFAAGELKSPVTGAPLANTSLIPNIILKSQIQSYLLYQHALEHDTAPRPRI